MRTPDVCRECGEDSLRWTEGVRNVSMKVDGKLKTDDVRPIFTLACESCNATVLVVDANNIALKLNELLTKHKK